MLLVYGDEGALDEAEREQCYRESARIAHDIRSTGRYLVAAPLQPVATATSIRGERLSEGGTTGRCGWLEDKFGVSWQIVPTVLGEMLADTDAERSQGVMKAPLRMDKIDIQALRRAYER